MLCCLWGKAVIVMLAMPLVLSALRHEGQYLNIPAQTGSLVCKSFIEQVQWHLISHGVQVGQVCLQRHVHLSNNHLLGMKGLQQV